MGNKTRKAQQAAKAQNDVQHHLLSLDLTPEPVCLHAYLMTTNSQRDIERVINKMLSIVEQQLGPGVPMVPIALATHLTTAIDEVRQELGRRHAEIAKTMAEATTFHLSMWFIPHDDPWHDRLMAIH